VRLTERRKPKMEVSVRPSSSELSSKDYAGPGENVKEVVGKGEAWGTFGKNLAFSKIAENEQR